MTRHAPYGINDPHRPYAWWVEISLLDEAGKILAWANGEVVAPRTATVETIAHEACLSLQSEGGTAREDYGWYGRRYYVYATAWEGEADLVRLGRVVAPAAGRPAHEAEVVA